jgi:hypothetical protein
MFCLRVRFPRPGLARNLRRRAHAHPDLGPRPPEKSPTSSSAPPPPPLLSVDGRASLTPRDPRYRPHEAIPCGMELELELVPPNARCPTPMKIDQQQQRHLAEDELSSTSSDHTLALRAPGREDEDVRHHRPFITGFAITGFIITKMTTNFTEEDLKNSKFILADASRSWPTGEPLDPSSSRSQFSLLMLLDLGPTALLDLPSTCRGAAG